MFSALDIKTLMQGALYGDPSLRVDTIRPIHSPLVGGLSIVMTPEICCIYQRLVRI